MDDNLSDEQFKAVFDDLKSIFGNPQYVYDMTCFEWKADEHYVRFGRIAVRYGLELPMIILTKESGDKKIEYTFYQQVADAFLKAKIIKYDCLLTWFYDFGFTHINIDGDYVYHVDFCGDCISAKKTRLPTEQEKQEMFSADNVEKRKELNKKLVVFDKKEYTSVDKLAQVLCDMIEN